MVACPVPNEHMSSLSAVGAKDPARHRFCGNTACTIFHVKVLDKIIHIHIYKVNFIYAR